jgi:hypothetical protein
MPPEAATQASSKLLDYGVLGAVCVLLIVALVWAVRGWLKAVDDKTAITEKYATRLEGLVEKYSATVARVEGGLTTSTSGMRALEANIGQFNTSVQVAMASRASRTATPAAFPAVRDRDREPGRGGG